MLQAQVASGTSKAGQTKGWADGQADGPNEAKIAVAFHPFGVDKLSSEPLYRMCAGRAIW